MEEVETRAISKEIDPVEVHDYIQFTTKFLYSGVPDEAGERETPSSVSTDFIRTVNYPMVVYWHRMKHMPEDLLYSSVFSQVFGQLLADQKLLSFFIVKILLEKFFLSDFKITKDKVFEGLSLDEKTMEKLWSDPICGIGSFPGLLLWYQIHNFEKKEQVGEQTNRRTMSLN